MCARTGLALRLAGAAVQRIAAGEALELACGAAALGGHPSDAAHCARDEPGVPDPASRLPHDRAGLLSCEMLTCEHASDNSGTFQVRSRASRPRCASAAHSPVPRALHSSP